MMSAVTPSDPAPERADWTRAARPVFLIGCPRSGTTWLQSLLASHPQVYTGTETHFFTSAHLVEREYWRGRDFLQGMGAYLEPQQFYALLRELFWRVVSTLPEPPAPPAVFLEKSPHHALVGETLMNTFPEARIIHLIRDPRTTVASLLRIAGSWAGNWRPANLEAAVEMWTANVSASRILGETLGPDRFLELRYEEPREAPEATLLSLWSWLGLPADAAAAAAAVAAHALGRNEQSSQAFPGIEVGSATIAGEQVAFPKEFIGRAARNSAETHLTPAQLRRIDELLGPLLERTGYLPTAPSDETAADQVSTGTVPFARSILLIGEEDDPTPLLLGLQTMAPFWQDNWDLVLTPHRGDACPHVAAHLEGDFQLLEAVPGETYAATLRRAAGAARAHRLLIPTDRGVFSIFREELLRGGGCRGETRAHVHSWLNWRAERRDDLFT